MSGFVWQSKEVVLLAATGSGHYTALSGDGIPPAARNRRKADDAYT
jgi:hypothetical protein